MTIRELAALAEVSIATVSLVLNNKEGVGPDTRQRILALIEQHGYVPRPPRAPRPRDKRTIRLIKVRDSGLLLDRNDEFVTRQLDGIIQAANAANFELIVSNVDISTGVKPMAEVCAPQDAGVIVLATEMPASMRGMLRSLHKPYVVLDNELHQQNDNAVTMNNEQAAYLVASHLFELGHRRIGFITSCQPAANQIARERGLVQAGEELGFVYDKKYRIMFPPSLEDANIQLTADVLGTPDFPTAFFAANDILAMAVLRLFRRIGKRVPEDYSLVGMDNLRASAISTPRLTSVKLPNETMGRMAVTRLIHHLENPDEPPIKTFVGCDLVLRQSTGRPAEVVEVSETLPDPKVPGVNKARSKTSTSGRLMITS